MRLVRLTVVGLVAAAVVTAHSGSSWRPHASPVSAGRADGIELRTASATLVPVPEQVSFDDLPTTRETARAAVEAATLPTTAPPPVKHRTAGRARDLPAAGTPQAVLAAAYLAAVARAPRGCHLRPEHLAAIGQVESGSVGGRVITADHRVSPAIFGPLLDGGPFAVIHDGDGGAYDGAGDYDRAMGPLQFLPGTWSWAGADGDDDGRRDPQNVYDAALAAAGYLCHAGRDLSQPPQLRSAVLAYNQSAVYLASVLEWVDYFRAHGLAALDDVAFRVGSGGRASDLAEPVTPPRPPAETPAPARSTPAPMSTPSTSTGSPTPSAPPPTSGPPSTPEPTTGQPSPSGTASSTPTSPPTSPPPTTSDPTGTTSSSVGP